MALSWILYYSTAYRFILSYVQYSATQNTQLSWVKRPKQDPCAAYLYDRGNLHKELSEADFALEIVLICTYVFNKTIERNTRNMVL
jgi:hypothetical protein